MTLKEKLEIRRFERCWERQGRKDFFTWIHRYLRLHRELLKDNIYKNIYDYFRNTLIAYLKKDKDCKKCNDEELGNILDVLADIFNKENVEKVNKYKSAIDMLYEFYLKCPDGMREIRI